MGWLADSKRRAALLIAAALLLLGIGVYAGRVLFRSSDAPAGSQAGSFFTTPAASALSAPQGPRTGSAQLYSGHSLGAGASLPGFFGGPWNGPARSEPTAPPNVAEGALGAEGGGGGPTQEQNQQTQQPRAPDHAPSAAGSQAAPPAAAAAAQGVNVTRLAPVPMPGPKVRDANSPDSASKAAQAANDARNGAYEASSGGPVRLNSSDAGSNPITGDRQKSFAIHDGSIEQGTDNGINGGQNANSGNASGENSITPR
ncbi:MAG: hypothetical protein NTX64_13455 [Elusimicrobia bacterium]|nr:hypothetical protein [Elusimicrobiota bacterium]